jgi:hypothetical protein
MPLLPPPPLHHHHPLPPLRWPQSKDYDPTGEYVKAWCPELRNVPAARVHEPWLMSKEEQERAGCRLGGATGAGGAAGAGGAGAEKAAS